MNTEYIQGLAQNTITFILRNFLNLGDEVMYADTSLVRDLGCDPLDTLEVIMAIESNLNITVDDSFLMVDNSGNTVRESLTIGELVDYCTAQISASLCTENATHIEPLPLKPTHIGNSGKKTSVTIDYNQALDMIVECSESKFIPIDTPLSDLGIEPSDVIEYILEYSTLDLSATEDYDIDFNHDCESSSITIETTAFTRQGEINTLSEFAEELSEGWNSCIELPSDNYYDWITDSCRGDGCFCEKNSYQLAGLDVEKLFAKIESVYGVTIDRHLAAQFSGTVEMLCNQIVEYINKGTQ